MLQSIFKPRLGMTLNKSKCRHSIYKPGLSMFNLQCARKPVVFEVGDDGISYGFCKVHSTAEILKRRNASDERYRAESKKRTIPYEKISCYEHVLNKITLGRDKWSAKMAAEALERFGVKHD